MTSSRRTFLGAALGGALLVSTRGGQSASAAPQAKTAMPSVNGKTSLTPRQALQLLKDGNRRFLQDKKPRADVTDAQRRLEIAKTQAPIVAYVSCSDSRVPPEILFGRGLGEMFIVRNAGNTLDTTAMGSVEYAIAELGVPLVVIMGHQRCGAVAAAAAVVEKNATYPGSIGRMIEPIIPAVLSARGLTGDLLDNAVRENVRRVVSQLREAAEPMILDPQRTGRLEVVGAYYELDTGTVHFFDEPKREGRDKRARR